jgi:hypothetical protein
VKRPGLRDFGPKPVVVQRGRLIDFYAILSAGAVASFPLKSTLCSPLGGMRKRRCRKTERVQAS